MESKIEDKVHQWTTKTKAIDYWTEKGRIQEGIDSDIQWELLGAAIRGLPPGRQLWSAKYFSGWEGTGVKMKQWGKRDTDKCQ